MASEAPVSYSRPKISATTGGMPPSACRAPMKPSLWYRRRAEAARAEALRLQAKGIVGAMRPVDPAAAVPLPPLGSHITDGPRGPLHHVYHPAVSALQAEARGAKATEAIHPDAVRPPAVTLAGHVAELRLGKRRREDGDGAPPKRRRGLDGAARAPTGA